MTACTHYWKVSTPYRDHAEQLVTDRKCKLCGAERTQAEWEPARKFTHHTLQKAAA